MKIIYILAPLLLSDRLGSSVSAFKIRGKAGSTSADSAAAGLEMKEGRRVLKKSSSSSSSSSSSKGRCGKTKPKSGKGGGKSPSDSKDDCGDVDDIFATPMPSQKPTRPAPTTPMPSQPPTPAPTTPLPSQSPTPAPTTPMPSPPPTPAPTTPMPTQSPTPAPTTPMPTQSPTPAPTTPMPSQTPTPAPTTPMPTQSPTSAPTTPMPSQPPTPVPDPCEGIPLVTDRAGFIDAFDNASTDPSNRTTICVAIDLEIDFDDPSEVVDAVGLVIAEKYFDAYCVGYDDLNKCIVKRSGTGRFFVGDAPMGVSFTGFRFQNGLSGTGGAFDFDLETNSIGQGVGEVAFDACDFFNNRGTSFQGGAVNIISYAGQEWNVSVNGCNFDSNSVNGDGGGIYARAFTGAITLTVGESVFSNNEADLDGADIYGLGQEFTFLCTSTDADDVLIEDGSGNPTDQTCSPPLAP